jgi:hypothetical protein
MASGSVSFLSVAQSSKDDQLENVAMEAIIRKLRLHCISVIWLSWMLFPSMPQVGITMVAQDPFQESIVWTSKDCTAWRRRKKDKSKSNK